MQKIKRKSISAICVCAIVILILPMNIYMLYSAHRSQEIILEHTEMNLENLANLYISELLSQVESINNYMAELELNNEFLLDITKQEDWDYYFISGMGLRRDLEEHMVTSKDANMYFYYSDIMHHGMVIENSEELTKSRLQDVIFSHKDNWQLRKWKIRQVDDTKWLVHINQWKNAYIGGGIQLESVENFISHNMENEVISAQITEEKTIPSSEEYLTVSKKCGYLNAYLHLQIEKAEVIRNLPLLQRYGYHIALMEFLSIPIILFVIQKLILKPLKVLRTSLNQLKSDPEVRICAKASTEDFDSVYQSFNKMADEIVQLKIDNYESKLEHQKIELRNLQLQIKPHFLFNSLHLMYNLVAMNEIKSVQKMLLYFANYFRYINIGENDFSVFQDELELIEAYLEISEIRYPNIFEVQYEISDEAREVFVPQLLVHNFVENIIKHGLDLQRKNHIILKAWVEDKKVIFCIQDDGIGMSEEQADKINQGIFEYEDGKKHLGLKNSYRRVKHFYGDKGSILIQSKKGKGTKVIVCLPVIET